MVHDHVVDPEDVVLLAPPQFETGEDDLPDLQALDVGDGVSVGLGQQVRALLLLGGVGREIELGV